MQLSPNFTLVEFTISETASRHGISNEPSVGDIENLKRLAHALEEVRMLLGRPLQITSGYRSPRLNDAIKGSQLSYHTKGLAADFIAPPLPVIEICRRIEASNIEFDQLIYEYQWVHLGLAMSAQRRQVLTKRSSGGYATGIVA